MLTQENYDSNRFTFPFFGGLFHQSRMSHSYFSSSFDLPYLESIINTILGSYLTHRTANDPFIILTTIYGDLTLLEEQLMEVMLDNPKKLKKFQDKLEEKVISMVKCEVKKYGYKEMYTSFEEAANALVVYIPLEEYTFDDDEKFLEIEKAIRERFPLISIEVIPLLKGEFIGKNMEYHEL